MLEHCERSTNRTRSASWMRSKARRTRIRRYAVSLSSSRRRADLYQRNRKRRSPLYPTNHLAPSIVALKSPSALPSTRPSALPRLRRRKRRSRRRLTARRRLGRRKRHLFKTPLLRYHPARSSRKRLQRPRSTPSCAEPSQRERPNSKRHPRGRACRTWCRRHQC